MSNDEITLARKMISAGALVVDVRTPKEFEESHLDQALHIPVQELEARITELEHAKERDIVVYCKSGQRSEYAKSMLLHYGFKSVVNGGGLADLS